MMKKMMSILLALAMCAGCLCAAAESAPTVQEMPVSGLTFTSPQALDDARGGILTDGAIQIEPGLYVTYWYYSAADEEEFVRLAMENPEELQARFALLFFVFSVGGGKEFTDVCDAVGSALDFGITAENTQEIGQEGDWKFYLCMNPQPGFPGAVETEFTDEYTALMGMKDEIVTAFAFSEPFNEDGSMDGKVIRFEATDLEGNPVSPEELFAQHEVTLVNIWATWCGPCVGELGELQAIHTRFLEKDCGVVGLMIDKDTEAAARLIAENGITYPVVLVPETFSSVFPFEAVPTSFFVDRNGAFLGTKIQGAQPDLYESALEPLLEQAKQANP